MTRLNLMPTHLLVRGERRRRLRAWAGAHAVGFALIGAATLQTAWATRRDARSEFQLETQSRLEIGELTRVVLDLRRQRQVLANSARAMIAMQGKHELPVQLARLTEATPDTVCWRNAAGARQARLAPKLSPDALARAATPNATVASAPAAPTFTHRVQIEGFALDHAALRLFVDSARSSAGVQHCEILETSLRPVLSGQALWFRIECLWETS